MISKMKIMKRVYSLSFTNIQKGLKGLFQVWSLFCSCHHRQRYGIDCVHLFHVVSQAKEFDEPNHHHINVQWWNTCHENACLSSNNK